MQKKRERAGREIKRERYGRKVVQLKKIGFTRAWGACGGQKCERAFSSETPSSRSRSRNLISAAERNCPIRISPQPSTIDFFF